jgi:amidohydrolase
MLRVQEHYEYLHTIPEAGLQEYKTAAYVADQLEQAGFSVQRGVNGSTGVVGVYDSGLPGPVLGIRADMDALTHHIQGKTVQRHTCGHDGHCAMLLAAAEASLQKRLVHKGKLKIIFQPAEELGIGAKLMVEGGVVDDVNILLGMHVRPIQECRKGEVIQAMLYSASAKITAVIHGMQAHGARPHLGINAIDGAVAAVSAVNAIHMDPSVSFSAKCTRFLADSGVTNAIPGEAAIVFDIRAQYNEIMKQLRGKMIQAIQAGAATVGATADIDISEGCPAAELDPDITKRLGCIITDTLGEKACKPPMTTPGGEDFFWYVIKRPRIKAGFTGLGVDAQPGLHHPDMHFDVPSLENGVRIHMASIVEFLQ